MIAQVTLPIPEIPWAAISPELVLFGAGLLVLILDTAGRDRLQASFLAFGVLAAGAGFAGYTTGRYELAGMVALAASPSSPSRGSGVTVPGCSVPSSRASASPAASA
jgi:NADH-quinone oxidoreductase subunit N